MFLRIFNVSPRTLLLSYTPARFRNLLRYWHLQSYPAKKGEITLLIDLPTHENTTQTHPKLGKLPALMSSNA